MLRTLAALVAAAVLAVGCPAQALADPVKDDGKKIDGFFFSLRDGSIKKKITRKGQFFYRGQWVTTEQLAELIRRCEDDRGTNCNQTGIWRVGTQRALQPIAVRLATQLRLPVPRPSFGPDPSVNEWKMLAVGFPVWLWTDGARTLTDTASAEGLTFTLTARLRSTTFSMGDGRSVTCTSMSRYSDAVKAGAPSPDCGHVYWRPSLPKGSYPVTATAHWDVAWSVAGMSGIVPVTRIASRQLPIGELSALNR